jgi:hypothetical protein
MEVDGQWQSLRGGAFLWLRHAKAREVTTADDGTIATWTADHDGYVRLSPSVRHNRSVTMNREHGTIQVTDEIQGGGHRARLAFHLGPEVEAELDGSRATLTWTTDLAPRTARLTLPGELRWSLHAGETDPTLGWYSSGLGHRVPAWTLLGTGRCQPGVPLVTLLEFVSNRDDCGRSGYRQVVQSGTSRASSQSATWRQVETG